jgi:hypothetical protein
VTHLGARALSLPLSHRILSLQLKVLPIRRLRTRCHPRSVRVATRMPPHALPRPASCAPPPAHLRTRYRPRFVRDAARSLLRALPHNKMRGALERPTQIRRCDFNRALIRRLDSTPWRQMDAFPA